MTRWSIAILLLATTATAAPLIAPANPLTPETQIKKFKLPSGFEIQLVASEPDIQKPMNLNFDSRGRLWVSHSIEYPFPAEDPDKARDGVTVLSNIGKDGKATTVTRFADKLNIPIGIVPINGGRDAIAWSIPHIWKLSDTNNDGEADKREVLYGPFGHQDTHGNQNAFTRGFDGWIYACHGFRNHSKIKLRGKGAVVLELQSGNTYRFKPDGSAIEQFTHGQVNPFGLCFNEYGDIFTADCHSKPVTMLLRGAYYPSFGKPHGGLGFAPQLTGNDHGSTGIGGIAYYADDRYPKEFRKCLYVGNVITNKVQRDVLTQAGSTYKVDKPVDFVTCDDPWFRPVDIQLGPDGALYIADFYNRIIGHYEVPLNHPQRDRHRGRIWRVVWKSEPDPAPVKPMPDLTKLGAKELVSQMASMNLTRRMLAMHEYLDRRPTDGKWGSVGHGLFSRSSTMRAHCAATMANLHLPDGLIERLDKDESVIVQRHLVRSLIEYPHWSPFVGSFVRSKLLHEDALIRRFAADALGRHPDLANIEPLLKAWSNADETDTFLIHNIRLALRVQLQAFPTKRFEPIELKRLVEIAIAVPTEEAAWFTFEYLQSNEPDQVFANRCMEHVAKHFPVDRVEQITQFVQKQLAHDFNGQWSLFESIHTGLAKRGVVAEENSSMGRWLTQLAPQLLSPQSNPMWTNIGDSPSPWGLRKRKCADGQHVLFIDSIVEGESLTGTLRSHPFTVPKQLSFYMCGHNGHPRINPPPVNHVRLVVDGKTIAKETPPRNDTARKYTWDLTSHVGKSAVIEIVDADTANAYAWIGVARFQPEVVCIRGFSSTAQDRTAAILKQIGNYRLTAHTPLVRAQLNNKSNPANVRVAATNAVTRLRGLDATTIATIVEAARTTPAGEQLQFAHALCSTRKGANALLDAIDQGKVSARLLQNQPLADRFKRVASEAMKKRSAETLSSIPGLNTSLVRLIESRKTGFAKAKPNIETGKALFAKHCAACHRLGDTGATLAPNLDGIHNRGADRLIEDILDPNRNVDQAFRLVTIETADGENVSGFGPREEGQTLVMSDLQGKPIRIRLSDVDSRRVSNMSPMPANVGDLMTEKQFCDLLAYLLSQ